MLNPRSRCASGAEYQRRVGPRRSQAITLITGESQAQAVATAVRERLARPEKDELAGRLLAIGHKTASRMSADATALDHDALLYDDRGLPS
jgi:antitoxin VapB